MPRYPRFSRPIALGVAIALASLAATAQESPAGLEEVVVTAQRVETDIQKTPVAVTALTGDFLRDYDFRQVTSIEGAAPNLNFAASTGGASSQVSAFIRGVGEFDFLLTTDPAVGLYIDGVYLARTFGANLDLADVERVEVLRGPQGTLFGKNNIGGAINLITRKPEGSGRTRCRAHRRQLQLLARVDHDSDIALGDDCRAAPLRRGSQVRRLAGPAGRRRWRGEPGRRARGAAVHAERYLRVDARARLRRSGPDQLPEQHGRLRPDSASVTFLGLFNAFVSPTNPCCTPNASIDESGVTEGLLPHDDLESLGASWFNNWTLGERQGAALDYRVPRHGGALRP